MDINSQSFLSKYLIELIFGSIVNLLKDYLYENHFIHESISYQHLDKIIKFNYPLVNLPKTLTH